MKILIISTVTGPYSWAGSEEMWKLMALEALKQGHQVTVCLQDSFCDSPELNDYRHAGGIAIPLEPLNWIQRRLAPKRLYSRFRKLENLSPDVICLSGPPAAPYRAKDLCAFLERIQIPKIYVQQGNDDGYIGGSEERKYLKIFYSQLAKVICVSHDNARLLQRQIAIELPRISILPNPIRTEIKAPLAWPSGNGDMFRFATVGRYEVGSKGQDMVMEALSALEWRERNWEWNLYGCGPDEEYLKDLISYYNLKDKVKIRGFERDFSKIWTDNQIHILCSRGEGLALALIESMFCGRPSIVTFTGGNHELVRDGIDGFVCMGNNPAMIRGALERAWNGRANFSAMGKSSFYRASEWVPRDVGVELLSLISKACGG
jgi:glycosyltransferase involved in cell wall biosynthesis